MNERKVIVEHYKALVTAYHKADAEYEVYEQHEDLGELYWRALCDAILEMNQYLSLHKITRDELTESQGRIKASSVEDCVREMREALVNNNIRYEWCPEASDINGGSVIGEMYENK